MHTAVSQNTPLAIPVDVVESQRKVLEQLHYLTTFRNQMVVIAGPEGAGKSTLLEVFLEQASDYANLAYLVSPQKLTVEQIRHRLLQQITSMMRMPEDISLSKSIRRALPAQPQHLMIVVDDAEQLPPVILDELQDLVLHSRFTAGRHRISVVVSGKTEWAARQKKRLPSNQSDAPEIIVVPEFSDAEALHFAKQLLSGHEKGRALAADTYRIQAALGTSLSYPGIIRDGLQSLVAPIEKTRYQVEDEPAEPQTKKASKKAARSNSKASSKRQGIPTRFKFAFAAAIIMTLGASAWMYRDDIMASYESFNAEGLPVTESGVTDTQEPTEELGIAPNGAEDSSSIETTALANSTELTSPVQPEDWLNPVLESGEGQLTMSYDEALPRLMDAAKEYRQEGEFNMGLYQVRSLNPLVAVATAAMENNAANAEDSEVSAQPATETTTNASPESVAVNASNAEDQTTQQEEVTQEPASNPWLASHDNELILQMNESRVALQLAAFSQESATNSFIEAQPNQNNLMVYHTLRNGGDWYVVVTGNYASLADARNAIEQLPSSQQSLQPWAKPFAWMQRELAVVDIAAL